ncbi:MAG: hypothetical protein LBU79_00635 [Planctomycetota bacterium]|nr:hypothetical protein [Planctomycetota bacterium]
MPAGEQPDRENREHLCRRCGVCCLEKLLVGGLVVITDVPCPHLDTHTRLCRIYERRHELETRCVAADDAATFSGLPGDCPHVQDIPGYRAPLLIWEHPELVEVVRQTYSQTCHGVEAPLPPGWQPTSSPFGPETD